jgi:hypothetical protein
VRCDHDVILIAFVVSSNLMTVARTFFSTFQRYKKAMKSPKAKKAVSFETGPDPKTGKIKAISVNLA